MEPNPIPRVVGTEDGEHWWAQGHVEPALMVLAAVVSEAAGCGPEEPYELLVGGTERFDLETGDQVRVTYWEHEAHADLLLGEVSHVWLVEDPDNEEITHEAAEGDEGAQPWTVLARPTPPWYSTGEVTD